MNAAFVRSRFAPIVALVVAATAAIVLWLFHVALPETPSIPAPSPLPASAAGWQRLIYDERIDEAQLRERQRARAEDAALAAEVLVLLAAAIAACYPYFMEARPRG